MVEHLGTPEEVLSRFSHRPSSVIQGMIQVSNPILPSRPLKDRPSSSGFLANLPVKILHMIVIDLDIQSFIRLSQVSYRAKVITKALPAYGELLQHTSHTLAALGQTGLANQHSIATLQRSLRLKNRVSCKRHGAFLLLLSCERCCFECLLRCQGLGLIGIPTACEAFNLSKEEVKRLPQLQLITGTYHVQRPLYLRRSQTLVSINMAKQLAVHIHGSEDGFLPSRIDPATEGELTSAMNYNDRREYWTLKDTREACLRPLFPQDPSLLPGLGPNSVDTCAGTGSIVFPHLSTDGQIDLGHWCLGCAQLYQAYLDRSITDACIPGLPMKGVQSHRVLWAWANHGRSRAEFLKHAELCYGIKLILSGLDPNQVD